MILTRQDKTRQDKTRQDKTRQDKTRQDKTRQVGIKVANKKGYSECDIGGVADFLYPTSKFRRGRVQGNGQISPTITAENTGVCRIEMSELDIREGVLYPEEDITKGNEQPSWNDCEYRIRKLTSREVGRLMDVEDSDIDKILSVNSNTQAYKQFGNSIVVSVLCALFSQLNIHGITPWNERTTEEKRELNALNLKG